MFFVTLRWIYPYFTVGYPDIVVKKYAFAIISRLAKSLGNSFGIKSTNNM